MLALPPVPTALPAPAVTVEAAALPGVFATLLAGLVAEGEAVPAEEPMVIAAGDEAATPPDLPASIETLPQPVPAAPIIPQPIQPAAALPAASAEPATPQPAAPQVAPLPAEAAPRPPDSVVRDAPPPVAAAIEPAMPAPVSPRPLAKLPAPAPVPVQEAGVTVERTAAPDAPHPVPVPPEIKHTPAAALLAAAEHPAPAADAQPAPAPVAAPPVAVPAAAQPTRAPERTPRPEPPAAQDTAEPQVPDTATTAAPPPTVAADEPDPIVRAETSSMAPDPPAPAIAPAPQQAAAHETPALHAAPAAAPTQPSDPLPAAPIRTTAPVPWPARQVAPFAVALALGPDASVSLTLEPVELGRVEVSIERVGAEQHVSLRAERPETLILLQRDRAELERALTDAGLRGEAGGGPSLSFGLGGEGTSGRERRGGGATRGTAASSAGDVPVQAAGPRSLIDLAI